MAAPTIPIFVFILGLRCFPPILPDAFRTTDNHQCRSSGNRHDLPRNPLLQRSRETGGKIWDLRNLKFHRELAADPGSIVSSNRMHDLIYLIGLIVVVMFILSVLGLR
jgi:hypothetical protein